VIVALEVLLVTSSGELFDDDDEEEEALGLLACCFLNFAAVLTFNFLSVDEADLRISLVSEPPGSGSPALASFTFVDNRSNSSMM